MPNWKKVIVSGSDASLNSLNVATNVVAQSFTGSLSGTSSYALNADLLDGKDSSVFATTGSNVFKGSQTIHGNLFMSGTFPLVYNNDSTNNMLFGMFDGSSIYGPYYQLFGNQYSTLSQRGGAEFVYDIRNNADANFHISSYNGSSWTQKFMVNDTGVQITGSLQVTGGITGSLLGTASYASQALSSSYALTASNAATASSANTFVVRNSLTASGLIYPTTDGAYLSQVLQTDAAGNLSFGDVQTTFDTVYNGEATTLVKGTPVYVSGSQGANPIVYRADAAVASKMPVVYVISEDIATASTGRGITLGHIEGINLTGYTVGSAVYVAEGGGWTATRPTGSSTTIQFLGLVTKTGTGGQGLVLNPGPVVLPNLQTGYVWVGNGSNQPLAVATSSIKNVISASYASFADTIASGLNITASNLLVSNNLVVNGTASFNYVQTTTGSAIIVGQQYIILNTQTPAARFAGLQIYDSGSASTASLVWDSQTDHFVYSKTSGSTYNGGLFIAGPKNTGSLGQEQTLTQWKVPVAQGDDHIMDSQIYSSGSITQITGSLSVTAGITGSLFGTSSWANNATTASYASLALTASYVSLAQTASYVVLAQTASYVLNSISSSYAANADLLDGLNSTAFATLTSSNTFTQFQTIADYVNVTGVTGDYKIGGVSIFNSTTNTIPKRLTSGGFTNSNISDNGTLVNINSNTNITGSTLITGIVGIGTSTTSSEGNLFLGAKGTDEGGQIFLQKGTATVSASMLDNYQNTFRVLTGTDTVSSRMDLELSHVTQNLRIFGDVIAYAASDKRLKENINPIENALDKVSKIGGYEFDWNNETEIHGHEGHDIGVIAQEIEEILPEVVTTRDNGYKAVKYEKIVPLLIQAIKELQQEINELKASK